MAINRQHQPEQDGQERRGNFTEVTSPFTEETAQLEASRCLNCKNAPCKKGCPVGIDIPAFISEIKKGNDKGAYDIIRQSNNLPSICGRVCPQEEQCEKDCIRKRMEGAVAIGALERYVGDKFINLPSDSQSKTVLSKYKVAIVGSGPAGLACAGDLASAGVSVTMFEAFHKAGGVLLYGIPEFRLPKDLLRKEIKKVLDVGVDLQLNTVVGKTISMEELLEEFDAVFIGSGAGLPKFLNIPGEGLCGVLSANEYLTRINLMGAFQDSDTPVIKGNRVLVFGAGNVAMDASRTAVRMGSEEVRIIYRRTMDEMPARKEEVRHAEEEGVIFNLLTAPVEFIGENGKLVGCKCLKCELGEPDERGRRSPKIIEGSEFVIDCDVAIIAVGTSPNPLLTSSFPDLQTSKYGTIVVDESMATSVDGVYAGGDATTGAATVILAMGAGKKASETILSKLVNK